MKQPPQIHRELLDPALAPYASRYVQYLRNLYAAGTQWYNKRVVTDTYYADLHITPGHIKVRLWPLNKLRYEFFTSDHVQDSTLASPGHEGTGPADLTHHWVCGSATRAAFKDKKSSVTACSSSTLTPPAPEDWTVRDCDSSDLLTLKLMTRRSWQNQKFFEHAWHPHNSGRSLVTSTQAQAPGLAGQAGWMSPYNYCRLASGGSKVSDYGLDVLPTLYAGSSIISAAPALDYPWVYWRRAAVREAGGRSFFISTDNYGRFQIYPARAYPDTDGVVPPGLYKTYVPPYPGWVTVPSPGDFRWQVNDWLWRFNKDATKCVSIPYHSDFDSGFFKTLDLLSFFATFLPSELPFLATQNAIVPAREDTPGLVEFEIEIEVYGPNEMDFFATFKLKRESYFPNSGRFFFDAAYALPDVEKTGVAEDTLVTAEIECWCPPGAYTAGPISYGAAPPYETIDAVAGMRGDVVVCTNDEFMVFDEKVRFTGASVAFIQFPTLNGMVVNHSSPSGPIGNNVPLAAGGSVFFASAGPVSLSAPHTPDPGFQFGRLYAMELSTLSMFYEFDDTEAGVGFLRGVAYGEEFYKFDYNLFIKPNAGIGDTTERITSARAHQYALDSILNTEWGMGFNVHPHGHWSFGLNAELAGSNVLGTEANAIFAEALDWISVKEKNDANGDPVRTRYRHKDLFNEAFFDDRDYPFYTEAFDGKRLWDNGSFRTHGIWITHR